MPLGFIPWRGLGWRVCVGCPGKLCERGLSCAFGVAYVEENGLCRLGRHKPPGKCREHRADSHGLAPSAIVRPREFSEEAFNFALGFVEWHGLDLKARIAGECPAGVVESKREEFDRSCIAEPRHRARVESLNLRELVEKLR